MPFSKEEKFAEMFGKLLDERFDKTSSQNSNNGFVVGAKELFMGLLVLVIFGVAAWVATRLIDNVKQEANYEHLKDDFDDYKDEMTAAYNKDRDERREYEKSVKAELEIIKSRTQNRFTYEDFRNEISRYKETDREHSNSIDEMEERIRKLEYQLKK
ncbi:hypothetical protein [Bernardetia sp.]|uniref:hypothetical protein n=1 Tax=Bernardetia sp. TaxID=1937974 RepID=UPI0025C3ADB1|nr:hypothetical protein [Bernardetia sp.]